MQNTNRFRIKCLIFGLIASLSLIITHPVLAQSGQPSTWLNKAGGTGLLQLGDIAYATPGEPRDIKVIVFSIISVVLGLLATIFLILIITAGIKWMTSQGDKTKIADARKTIVAASAGLLLILASYAITIYITRASISVTTNATRYDLDSSGPRNSGDVKN